MVQSKTRLGILIEKAASADDDDEDFHDATDKDDEPRCHPKPW